MIKLIVEDYLNEGSYIDFGGQANPPYGWAVCLAVVKAMFKINFSY